MSIETKRFFTPTQHPAVAQEHRTYIPSDRGLALIYAAEEITEVAARPVWRRAAANILNRLLTHSNLERRASTPNFSYDLTRLDEDELNGDRRI